MMSDLQLHRGFHSRGYVPHFDMPGLYQSITFRLKDSIPATLTREMHAASNAGSQGYQESLEDCLERNLGRCILRIPAVAAVVQDGLLHFDGERYRQLHWVVMPNHVHSLIQVLPGHPLDKIIKTWKAYSAMQINKL